MPDTFAEKKAADFLALAGIRLHGDRPQDIQVIHPDFYRRIMADGSLGLGESYVDGWWECERLDRFFYQILAAKLDQKAAKSPTALFMGLKRRLLNLQTESGAFQVGERHYDIGNDLFTGMLDARMTYTCGYWKNALDLEEAQEAKLDLVCRKLGLRPGQRVLDIGCGWGSFIKFAAERYGVQAVGVTISKEQRALGQLACQGLPVEIRLQDYREVDEKFDHIVSLGMFEHVGPKNHREYFQVVRRAPARGRLLPLAHHRLRRHRQPARSLDREVHLPQLHAAQRQEHRRRLGGPLPRRGLAQPGAGLRPDPRHGLVRELRAPLAQPPAQIQPALLPGLEVLSALLCGDLQGRAQPGLADPLQPQRRPCPSRVQRA